MSRNQITNMHELEAELFRLHTKLRSNTSVMDEQWVNAKKNFFMLSWNSFTSSFATTAKRAAQNPLGELASATVSTLLKWLIRKFR